LFTHLTEPNDSQNSSLTSGKQNTIPEYTENMEDGRGVTQNPEIILPDTTSTPSTEISGLSKF
jgi:hypothetical protein